MPLFLSLFQIRTIFWAKECTKILTTEKMLRVGDFGIFPQKFFMHLIVFVRKAFGPLSIPWKNGFVSTLNRF